MIKVRRYVSKSLKYVALGTGIAIGFGFNKKSFHQGYLYFSDNMFIPLVRLLPIEPETVHDFTIKALSYGISPQDLEDDDIILEQSLWGLKFSNPVGLAAGYDKNGEAVGSLLNLGFSFVEIGSVVPKPQPGNEMPRMFRLPEDKAVINRYGFNSKGMDAVHDYLSIFHNERQKFRKGYVGINAGKNKATAEEFAKEDYAAVITKLGKHADYLVINVSSPNTPGLRDLQRREMLTELLTTCKLARNEVLAQCPKKSTLPLLVKIAPDLTTDQIDDLAAVMLEGHVDGMIISNTTISRPTTLISSFKSQSGGLSGTPVRDLSTQLIATMYKKTQGKVPIIGVGGVANGRDALDKIEAGASLIQMYTMLVYEGPGSVQRTKKELTNLLRAQGYASVHEAIGAKVKSTSI